MEVNDGARSVSRESIAVGRTMRVQKEFLALRPHSTQFQSTPNLMVFPSQTAGFPHHRPFHMTDHAFLAY